VLSVSLLANGSSNSNIGASSNAAANLVMDGGTLRYTGGAISTNRLFTLTNNGGTIESSGSGALTFSNTAALAYTGTSTRTLNLAGTHTGVNSFSPVLANNTGETSLGKQGASLWTLVGVNTYTGSTTVSAGTLVLSNTSGTTIADSSAVTVSSGATLDLRYSETLGSLAGAGSITTGSAGAKTLTVGGLNTDTSLSGASVNGSGS
jgi:autotransporter-associated beta strand protein